MKKSLFPAVFFILVSSVVFSQSVSELNKTAKQNSGRSTGNSGTSSRSSGSNYSSGSSGGGDAEGFFYAFLFVARLFTWSGQGIIALAKEEGRLYQKNKELNSLYYLEANGQAGYGFTDFVKLQPQARLHLGWVSFDFRQTYFNDRSTEFKTFDFMTWFNFVNREKFKLRLGVGNLTLQNTNDSYFLYGGAIEVMPAPKWRLELWGNQTQAFTGTLIRPRQEVNFRCHYDFWQKGYGKASFFGGVSNQKYYSDLAFTSFDAGLNFSLSFHKYKTGL